MIVIVEKNENGKIEFTKEELKALLEEAKEEGEKEARKQLPTAFSEPAKYLQGTPTHNETHTMNGTAVDSEGPALNGSPFSSGI